MNQLQHAALQQCFHSGSTFDSFSLTQWLSRSRSCHNYLRAARYVRDRAVLDVGAGEGVGYHNLAAGAPKSVTSLDSRATGLADRQGGRKNFTSIQGDFLTTDFQEKFDVILMFGSLYWFADPVAACRKAFHLLREDGQLIFNYPSEKFVRCIFGTSRWSNCGSEVALVEMGMLDSALAGLFGSRAEREGQGPFIPANMRSFFPCLREMIMLSMAPRRLPAGVLPFYEFRVYQKAEAGAGAAE